MLRTCGVVDQTLSMESGLLASLMSGADEPAGLRASLTGCEYAVAWLRDPDGALKASFAKLGLNVLCLEAPTPVKTVHQSKRFLQVLGWEPNGDHQRPPALLIPDTVREAGSRCLRSLGIEKEQGFVVCHPGSGSVHKCVDPNIMAAVVRNIQEQGVLPVLVGGPADDRMVERVRGFGLQDVPVIQGESLTTVAGVLAQARLYVGHDSGLTHLAARLQVPTVAMFGPTDPSQWAPQGAHVSIITGSSCSCPTWERVRGCQPKPCLPNSPEAVNNLCRSLLSRSPQ